jgi:hypothetical protein
MKTLKLILLCLLINPLIAQQNPYADLTYDSLVIYDFDWQGLNAKYRSIIDEQGNLPPTVKRAVTLTVNEATEISNRIGEKSSYGQMTAACFDPHFGMVYYEQGLVKEFITICMACNYPRTSIPLPVRDLGTTPDEMETNYSKMGFSKAFRTYLFDLKRKYGFSAVGKAEYKIGR